MSVTTVSGQQYWCEGSGLVDVMLKSGQTVSVDVLVVAKKPLGFSVILGMNGVNAMKGVTVNGCDDIRFGVEQVPPPARTSAICSTLVSSDEADFTVTYDTMEKKWSVQWKWSGGKEPGQLYYCFQNKVDTRYSGDQP